jgi:hypothetical protein
MKYRVLTCLAVLGSSGCGADDGAGDREEVGISRSALNVANGTEFKNKLTADPSGSYTLTADIDMNGTALHVTTFNGTLDGAGHTIKNVKQVLASSSGDAGLFGQLRGTVKNLKLTGVNVRALSAGGLASKCTGAIIQNVSVSGAVEAGGNAGGICGSSNGGSFTSSSASGTVKSTGGYAGGLIGTSSIGRSSLGPAISSSSVAGMTVTGVQATGGLMGYCQDPIILRSSVDATVSGQATAGGICGEMNGGHIENSYARGASVTSSGGPAGGLVGKAGIGMIVQVSDRVEIRRCYSQFTNVTALTEAGGIVGTGKDPFMYDVYTRGNVTGTDAVGGLVGRAQTVARGWCLNNGIYRGAVTDRSRPWAGVVGQVDLSESPTFRWVTTLFNSELEGAGDPYLQVDDRQKPATGLALITPTTTPSGVYCWGTPPNCGDSTFPNDDWNPGTSGEHHTLRNMPGPNPQPK